MTASGERPPSRVGRSDPRKFGSPRAEASSNRLMGLFSRMLPGAVQRGALRVDRVANPAAARDFESCSRSRVRPKPDAWFLFACGPDSAPHGESRRIATVADHDLEQRKWAGKRPLPLTAESAHLRHSGAEGRARTIAHEAHGPANALRRDSERASFAPVLSAGSSRAPVAAISRICHVSAFRAQEQ